MGTTVSKEDAKILHGYLNYMQASIFGFRPRAGGELRYDYGYPKRRKPRARRSYDETHPEDECQALGWILPDRCNPGFKGSMSMWMAPK